MRTPTPALFRIACKMATGSGKTVVMAMLIAWQTLNKLANPQDARFTDTFLIVTPGITIRDRLRVLMPNDPDNYYRKLDIVPPTLERIGQGQNRHHQLSRVSACARHTERRQAHQSLLTGSGDAPSPFTETPDQMVRRVCRELGNKKNIIVLNDEAHHCYRRRAGGEDEKLTGDDRQEAEKREEEARVWISGLEAVKPKSASEPSTIFPPPRSSCAAPATPRARSSPGSFPTFPSLTPSNRASSRYRACRCPTTTCMHDAPTYRDIWPRISENLPKKGRGTEAVTGEPKLPVELEGALAKPLQQLRKILSPLGEEQEAQAKGLTPPVFIVVCNNTNVSKLVFDYIAGWEKQISDGKSVVVPGNLPFSATNQDGGMEPPPQHHPCGQRATGIRRSHERGLQKIAAREIEEFKADYRVRFPGRDADNWPTKTSCAK